MAGNRYYAEGPQEVLESYEWLMRETLTKLDQMARNIRYDLQAAWVPSKEIDEIISVWFAQMWEQVAETEAVKAGKGKRKHGKAHTTRRRAER